MAANAHRVVRNGSSTRRTADDGQASRHELVQRVASSPQFVKSSRLRQFLLYVCERTLEDSEALLHEQAIGHAVFGRPVDYDTAQDNIVRVTASQARKKLEQYFALEGQAEPTLLEIPKGQYVPVFRERNVIVEVKPADRIPPGVLLGMAASAPILTILALGLAIALWTQRPAMRPEFENRPMLAALWTQLLPNSGRTDIVVSDSSLSLYEELMDHPLSLADYLKQDQWTQAGELSGNPRLQFFAQQAAKRHFTSLANVTVAYRIAQLAVRGQTRPSIFSARDFNIRGMKFDNVILLGSSRANPWMELIQDELNFRFGFDQQSRHSYFENRSPRAGELKAYRTDSASSYCQVAFLPNLGKTGNILAIAGTEVEGTEGGGEFLTSERSMAGLRKYVQPDRDGRLPFFEILLKSSRVGGATPGFSIVAFRTPHF